MVSVSTSSLQTSTGTDLGLATPAHRAVSRAQECAPELSNIMPHL